MKINFEKEIFDRGGKSFPKKLTLGAATDEALCQPLPFDQSTGQQKYDRYQLAERLKPGGTIEVRVEDVAIIKEMIGRVFGPAVVGQAWDMLEGKGEKG